jgi:hypothetical protein
MSIPARTMLLANGQRFTLEPGGDLPPRAIAGHFTPVNTQARITAAGGGNNPFFNPGNVFEFHCDAAIGARPGMRVRPRRLSFEPPRQSFALLDKRRRVTSLNPIYTQ